MQSPIMNDPDGMQTISGDTMPTMTSSGSVVQTLYFSLRLEGL
jgi:hypothetical protein